MQLSNQAVTPPGISTLCIWSKAILMPSTLLMGCHIHHLSISQWFLIVMMSSWQTLLYCNLSQRMSGCLPMGFPIWAPSIFTLCWRGFHPTNLLRTFEKSWGWLHHQHRQKSYEHWNHSLGNFGYKWGRWGKAGMITAFCRSDWAKVEPSDALLSLVQWHFLFLV